MKHLSTSPLKKAGAALTITALTIAPLFAQEEGEVAQGTLLDKYLISGGPLTWVIVAVGLLSVFGLIAYNALNLTKSKFNPDDLKAALYDHCLLYTSPSPRDRG